MINIIYEDNHLLVVEKPINMPVCEDDIYKLLSDTSNLTIEELERQIPLLPRAEIARASIDDYGKIIVTESIDEAIDIAKDYGQDDSFKFINAVLDNIRKEISLEK